MKKRSRAPLVPLDGSAGGKKGEKRITLLVPPRFYLVRREALPLRFAFQAKRIAPALMEEIGAEPSWSFEVYREGEEWVFLAYDPRKLEEAMREQGLDPASVERLCFAQQLAGELERPYPLNEREALLTVEGVVTQLPARLVERPAEEWWRADGLEAPARTFPFHPTGLHSRRWLGESELRWIAAALLLLAAAWSVEAWRDHREAKAMERQLQQRLEASPELASGIARRNILEKYEGIDRRQRELRGLMSKIGSLIGRDSKLESLTLDDRGYRVAISATDSRLATLKKRAESEGIPARVSPGELLLEGKWSWR